MVAEPSILVLFLEKGGSKREWVGRGAGWTAKRARRTWGEGRTIEHARAGRLLVRRSEERAERGSGREWIIALAMAREVCCLRRIPV
jgi:hypothetical protein